MSGLNSAFWSCLSIVFVSIFDKDIKMHSVKLLIFAMLVFLLLDMIWLGWLAKPLYFKAYSNWLDIKNGQLQAVWWAALIVYALFALAIVFMVLPLANGSLFYALCYGAFFGLVTYGIYDFTCLAIFKNWPLQMAFVDWAWGTTLCAVSSFLTAYANKFIF